MQAEGIKSELRNNGRETNDKKKIVSLCSLLAGSSRYTCVACEHDELRSEVAWNNSPGVWQVLPFNSVASVSTNKPFNRRAVSFGI